MKTNPFFSNNSNQTSFFFLAVLLILAIMMASPLAGQSLDATTQPIKEKIAGIQEMLLDKNQEVRKLESKIQDTYGTSKETWKKTGKMRAELKAAQEEVALIERAMNKWEMILAKTQQKIETQKTSLALTREKADLALTHLPTPTAWEGEQEMGMVAR